MLFSFFPPLRNYCLYLVPTSCFLPEHWQAGISHIFRRFMLDARSILFIFVALQFCFALPFTSQSIWAHLLYVDHCLDSARTRARGRTSERRRRGSQHHAKRCNHFSGMAYCVLHWRRSRTEYGRRHLVFAESASWRLLFLISLSGKIIKAREKLIIIDVFTPFLPQCNPIPVVAI